MTNSRSAPIFGFLFLILLSAGMLGSSPGLAQDPHLAVIFAEEPSKKSEKETKPPGPTPAPVDATKPAIADQRLQDRSNRMVTVPMLEAAQAIAKRLSRHVAGAKSFEDKQRAFQSFRLTSEEQSEVAVLGFRSLTIEVGGGGNTPYLIGGSLSQGVAFGLTPGSKLQVITSGGFSVGVPGGAAEIRIGFWKASIDGLASWSMGVNASAVGPKKAGVGVGVFWDFSNPPQFEGFNVGITFSKPGVGGDAGFAWTEYTGQIINTTQDALRVVSGKPTQHGKPLGGSCTVGTDCRGYIVPVGSPNAGVACCKGKCVATKKDYLGVSWCPHTCKKGPFAKKGSC